MATANMRVPNFPIPLLGEAVQSAIVRYLMRTAGFNSNKLEGLGISNIEDNALLLKNLELFTKVMPVGHPWYNNPKRLIFENSLIPLYLFFAPPDYARRAINAYSKSNTTVSHPYGSKKTGNIFSIASNPKFCQSCVDQDIMEYGFPVRYREHQPGFVKVCVRHKEYLRYDCSACNTKYRMRKRWKIPGRCDCENPIFSSVVSDEQGERLQAWSWIAEQVASIFSLPINSKHNLPSLIRQKLIDSGFGKSGGIDGDKVDLALRERFGEIILSELNISNFRSGGFAPYPRRWAGRTLTKGVLAQQKHFDILRMLLLASLIVENIGDLREAIVHSEERKEYVPVGYGSKPYIPRIPVQKIDITNALTASQMRLSSAAAKLGLDASSLLPLMRVYDIQFPLPRKFVHRIGPVKIKEIENALREGMPKIIIRTKYSVSEWVILLIEYANSELHGAHLNATIEILRSKHRSSIVEYYSRHPTANITELLENCGNSAYWAKAHDRIWLYSILPKRKFPSVTIRPRRKDWAGRDQNLVEHFEKFVSEELKSKDRPRWLSYSRILNTSPPICAVSSIVMGLCPKAKNTVARLSESKDQYYDRKIRWALLEYLKLGLPLSSFRFYKIAGMEFIRIKERREFIRLWAEENGLPIDPRSLFAST